MNNIAFAACRTASRSRELTLWTHGRGIAAMSDEELAMAYVGGNDTAFDLLLSRSKTKLFAYILFVVRCHDVAEDVFQDTFLKAILKLKNGEYKPTGRFSCWLTRIAHNVIMDRFRAIQNSPIVDMADDNDVTRLEGGDAADEPIETCFVNEQTLRDVRHLMAALPPVQREVVFMRFFQELPFKEIAELTGVSINTSLGRMRYAVLNLRRMVKAHGMELRLLN